MRSLLAALVFIPSLFIAAPTLACGPDSNCAIENDRHYRIRIPKGHDGKTPIGAIIYAHGYKGNASGAMNNKSLGKAASDLGLALISVKSAGPDWHIPNAPSQHPPEEWVELEYFDNVIADVEKRFSIDTSKLLMTGFSAGAMMTWTLACERSEKFVGFVPMSGTFWAPHPQSCPSPPANVIHYHGAKDQVVPLKGRRIGPARQGNVFDVLTMYEKNGDYIGDVKNVTDKLSCIRKTNPDAKILELCLYDGGHGFKSDYIVRAWKKLKLLSTVNGGPKL
ncbi:MAG: polyhydroxybutyrate depolymerase [Hyphomicrobiales bacterium]